MDLPVWQALYEEFGDDNFVIISAAQDSQGEAAAGKWFDQAGPTYHCVVDDSHKISTLFSWVNVPSAAWIDEEGRIVRSNEGAYAGEHTISVAIGDSAEPDEWKFRDSRTLVFSTDAKRVVIFDRLAGFGWH